MLIIRARSFATLGLLNPFSNWSNERIANEDRAVVEPSFPVELLQFRKDSSETLEPSGV